MSRIVLISLYDEFCLGPRYIVSFLRHHGHEADLVLFKHCHAGQEVPSEKRDPDDYLVHFYASVREIRLLQEFIKERDPLWVGFSFMSLSSGLAEELTRRVREVTDAPVVWGGVDATVNPDWAIEHANVVCIGEGENAALELTHALAEKRDPSGISNLWIRQNGAVVKNPIRPLIQDMDSLPHPNFDESAFWHIDRDEIRQGQLPDTSPLVPWFITMTSRGCPYRCSFCVHSSGHERAKGKGKYLRRRSVDNVIEELIQQKKKRPFISQIMFYDDVFTFDRAWIAEFAEAYKLEIDVPFWVYAYPEMCDPVILKSLKDIGLNFLKIGIQSGSERILREVFDRNLSPDRILHAAQTLKDLDIFPIYDILVGIPIEQEEDLRASLDVLLQLPEPFGLNVWPIIYYRNYKITEIALNCPGKDRMQSIPGTNLWIMPAEDPYLRFWLALMRLTRYPQVPRETIRSFVENKRLRDDPSPLEIMEQSLFKANFVPNSEFHHKDTYIETIQQENRRLIEENRRLHNEIQSIQNSKAFRLQSKVKQVLGRR